MSKRKTIKIDVETFRQNVAAWRVWHAHEAYIAPSDDDAMGRAIGRTNKAFRRALGPLAPIAAEVAELLIHHGANRELTQETTWWLIDSIARAISIRPSP